MTSVATKTTIGLAAAAGVGTYLGLVSNRIGDPKRSPDGSHSGIGGREWMALGASGIAAAGWALMKHSATRNPATAVMGAAMVGFGSGFAVMPMTLMFARSNGEVNVHG